MSEFRYGKMTVRLKSDEYRWSAPGQRRASAILRATRPETDKFPQVGWRSTSQLLDGDPQLLLDSLQIQHWDRLRAASGLLLSA